MSRGGGRPRAWRAGVLPKIARAGTREAQMTEEDEARAWQRAAPVLGFCGACGVSVDEAKGVLHDKDCPHLPPERRRAS